MHSSTPCAWILDSGGAGRGAWQGGVLYELMRWTRQYGGYPAVTMGSSAGGYAAADIATGTEATVMKGWTAWGTGSVPERYPLATFIAEQWPRSRFRRHLHASIRYVMGDAELDGVFDESGQRTLLLFTSRVRRRDGRSLGRADLARLFTMAATRKLPRLLKYVPRYCHVDPVVFATNLPGTLHSEFVRPLTRQNYHCAIEASCLVPLAMGPPVSPGQISPSGAYPDDIRAVFVDGGFSLKMPMATFEEDTFGVSQRHRPTTGARSADNHLSAEIDQPRAAGKVALGTHDTVERFPFSERACIENDLGVPGQQAAVPFKADMV